MTDNEPQTQERCAYESERQEDEEVRMSRTFGVMDGSECSDLKSPTAFPLFSLFAAQMCAHPGLWRTGLLLSFLCVCACLEEDCVVGIVGRPVSLPCFYPELLKYENLSMEWRRNDEVVLRSVWKGHEHDEMWGFTMATLPDDAAQTGNFSLELLEGDPKEDNMTFSLFIISEENQSTALCTVCLRIAADSQLCRKNQETLGLVFSVLLCPLGDLCVRNIMDLDYQDWMSALPFELWDTPLTELAIPGSHDAMTYCLDITSPLVRSESDTLRRLDHLFYCITRPFIFKWATTQVKSIEEQLSMGIRYFDFRIAHKESDPSSNLYFKHAIYTQLTVLEAFASVATWLNSHPKEIVILACSHFEGMDCSCHESFISSLKKLFGSKMCPYTEPVLTLRSLWASGYQVILSYEDQIAVMHRELWPAIPYWWADQSTAEGVISQLERMKAQGRPGGFFVSGLNLTVDMHYIIKNCCESLKTLTYDNWECFGKWVEEQTPGSEPASLNIIAGDFVGPLPLCSLVILLNQKLQQRKSSQIKKC